MLPIDISKTEESSAIKNYILSIYIEIYTSNRIELLEAYILKDIKFVAACFMSYFVPEIQSIFIDS